MRGGTRRADVQAAIAPRAKADIVATVDAPLPKLSKDELLFCGHYAIHANGLEAARFAKFPLEHLRQKAHVLLTRADIQMHIRRAREEMGELHFDVANQLINQLNAMRLADITKIYDADGSVLDPEQWPEDLKLLLDGIDIEERMEGEGDNVAMVRTKKVRFASRLSVMSTLAKIMGILQPEDKNPGGSTNYTQVNYNITVGEKK